MSVKNEPIYFPILVRPTPTCTTIFVRRLKAKINWYSSSFICCYTILRHVHSHYPTDCQYFSELHHLHVLCYELNLSRIKRTLVLLSILIQIDVQIQEKECLTFHRVETMTDIFISITAYPPLAHS